MNSPVCCNWLSNININVNIHNNNNIIFLLLLSSHELMPEYEMGRCNPSSSNGTCINAEKYSPWMCHFFRDVIFSGKYGGQGSLAHCRSNQGSSAKRCLRGARQGEIHGGVIPHEGVSS